ncbi:MAG: M15 family metallopeptidase [Cellvibrionaceae bacterium]
MGGCIQYTKKELLITGQDESNLVCHEASGGRFLHKNVLPHFISLKAEAKKAGFELAIASSYRNFHRQSIIWNEKAKGIRAVMNDVGEEVNVDVLNKWELVQAILRWSALPSASRHHWGTDLDVYDKSQISDGYELQLSHSETEEGGVFSEFHYWLNEVIASNRAHGFYRPYEKDCGGIGCEPWHLSYKPLADQFSKLLTVDLVRSVIATSQLNLRETVLENLDEIYKRFICL